MELKHAIKDGKLCTVDEGEDFFWLEVISPTQEEMKDLLIQYQLPRDYVFDINDPYEIPRVEGLDSNSPNLFILDYPIKISETKYITRAVSIIIVDDIVISVRNEESIVFSQLKSENLIQLEKNESVENFLLELTWRISKTYVEYVKNLNEKIQELETRIKSTTKTEYLYEMIEIQRSLTHFQLSTRENGPVIENIFRLEYLFHSEFRDDLLHDLLVENKQAGIMIENSTTMLDKLSDLYSNVISNNLNSVMKVLTSITIVLTIPTIVGGLWGMNVRLPMEDNSHAFLILMLTSLVISIVILYFLKKKDYL